MSSEQFVIDLEASRVVPPSQLRDYLAQIDSREDSAVLADRMVNDRLLTAYQARMILEGKTQALVLGDYVLREPCGRGGHGLVFQAEHRRLRRVVALKILSPALLAKPAAVARFQREMELIGKLDHHPNIVKAFDAREEKGLLFLVMEFVPGVNLADQVYTDGPLAIGETVAYMMQAACGLDHAHTHNIIHRDVKPGNLLVDATRTVKILDLGLARVISPLVFPEESPLVSDLLSGFTAEDFPISLPHDYPLTDTGKIIGSVDYTAPEQVEDSHLVDARTDIYSLGCTFCYLLTGAPPYYGESMIDRAFAHIRMPIPSLRDRRPEIPENVEAIVQRMLAKNPNDRFQTMGEVFTALRAAQMDPLSGVLIRNTSKPTFRPPEDLESIHFSIDPGPIEAVALSSEQVGLDPPSPRLPIRPLDPAIRRRLVRSIFWTVTLGVLVIAAILATILGVPQQVLERYRAQSIWPGDTKGLVLAWTNDPAYRLHFVKWAGDDFLVEWTSTGGAHHDRNGRLDTSEGSFRLFDPRQGLVPRCRSERGFTLEIELEPDLNPNQDARLSVLSLGPAGRPFLTITQQQNDFFVGLKNGRKSELEEWQVADALATQRKHLLIVLTESELTVYVNGQQQRWVSVEPLPPWTHGHLVLGGNDETDNWRGTVSRLSVYDRALTPAEARRHFQLTQP